MVSQLFLHGSDQGVASTETERQALFNKLGTQELVRALRRDSKLMDIPWMTRPFRGGKSIQIKVTARTGSGGHTRGSWILEDNDATGAPFMKNPKIGEVVIGLDRAQVSGVFEDEMDNIMAPDSGTIRTEIAYQQGESITRTFDYRRFCNLIQGALAATNPYNDEMPGGTVINEANIFSTAAATVSAFQELATSFDDKYIPEDQRYVAVRPQRYHWMVNNLKDDIVNVDYRGEGSVARAEVVMIQGIKVFKSTNIPNSNVTTANTEDVSPINDYNVDARNVEAVAFHPTALGVIHPLGLGTPEPRMDTQYYKDRLGWGVWSLAYSGSKFVRPEACAIIRTAAPA